MNALLAIVSKCYDVITKNVAVTEQVSCNYCDDYYGDRTCHIHRSQE
ncbi:hypothetical protein [Marinomonas epiphytica]